MYKILHIYRTFFPDTQGGAEEVIRQLAHAAIASGQAQVRVLVSSKYSRSVKKIDFQGIDVIQVPELFEVASCNVYRGGFRELQAQVKWADIIHYHYPWPFQDLLHFAFVAPRKKKTVVTYHSDIVRQKLLGALYSPLQNLFLNSVDRIVATSPNYLESSPVLQKFKHKVDVVPLGLDAATMTQPTPEGIERVQTTFRQPFFFFVGVLRYYKGLHILIEAAAKSKMTVVIAGDGPELNNLLELKKQLNADTVHIIGRITDEEKAALFKACLAVVLPSFVRSEAFGVVLLEAMYYGKAMITSCLNTGVTYANLHLETGFTTELGSPESLSEALQQFSKDPEQAGSMGLAARARYEDLFTVREFGSGYLRVYKELMGR